MVGALSVNVEHNSWKKLYASMRIKFCTDTGLVKSPTDRNYMRRRGSNSIEIQELSLQTIMQLLLLPTIDRAQDTIENQESHGSRANQEMGPLGDGGSRTGSE